MHSMWTIPASPRQVNPASTCLAPALTTTFFPNWVRSARPVFPAQRHPGPVSLVHCPTVPAFGDRSEATGGSVSKRFTVDRHLGTVGVEGQHPFHIGGLNRR